MSGMNAENVVIEFGGHGIWGVGGGTPDDGVYFATLQGVEYRTSRRDATAKPKLYWTAQFDTGYQCFDHASLPGPDAKPGVEKAFVRLLVSAGVIPEANVEAISKGGLKGQRYKLSDLIRALEGKRIAVHYLKPRSKDDRHQTTYLYGSEVSKVQAGEVVIADSRTPAAELAGSPMVGDVALPVTGSSAPTTATAPVSSTARPPTGGNGAGVAAAVDSLLKL